MLGAGGRTAAKGTVDDKLDQGSRRHERHPGVLQVSFRDIATIGDYTENLSEGGLFIVTETAFEAGERIHFELSFPGLVKPIPLEAEVVWRRVRESLDDERPPGIGVRLLLASDVERSWLRQLIARFVGTESSPAGSGDIAKPERLLLVEDNPLTCELFRDALQGQGSGEPGYEVVEVETTSGAWQVYQSEPVDLLLIEARLCREGELDLLESIRKIEAEGARRIPVIVLVGKKDEQQWKSCGEADVVLRRPVPAKALLRTLRSLGTNTADDLV